MLSASNPSFSPGYRKITTRAEFQRHWGCHLNFLMGGECIPFDFEFPPVESLVEAVRSDPGARILRGKKGDRADERDISEEFRALPLEEAVEGPFQMSHFNLSSFYGQGEILWGLREQVMTPWRNFLREAGFSWRRCFPILFVSGPDSATNYHMDLSQVLALQVCGIKTFSGFMNPSKWVPLRDSVREDFRERMSKPRDIPPQEVLFLRHETRSVSVEPAPHTSLGGRWQSSCYQPEHLSWRIEVPGQPLPRRDGAGRMVVIPSAGGLEGARE